MNSNTFISRFGIDPDNFKNIDASPIPMNNGFNYYLEQKTDKIPCPNCNSNNIHIKGYYTKNINCSCNGIVRDVLTIKMVRFICNDCHSTFSKKINGVESRFQISDLNKKLLMFEFASNKTFSEIAIQYDISPTQAIKYFDECYPIVRRKKLPEVLCIDEFHFSTSKDCKYCCVISDYKTKKVVDIIKSRKLAYLNQYFMRIPRKELENVKVFISDMYDGYATIKRKFFRNAIHIIDKFHIIVQMTNALKQVRIYTMKKYTEEGSITYNFMKKNWKVFLCRREDVPDKFYYNKKTKESYHYDDMIFTCIKLNYIFHEGYEILQDLFKYNQYDTTEEARDFILWIADRLISTNSKPLIDCGNTFIKWIDGISYAFSKNQYGNKLTNAIAESNNNHIKTIIKKAYGFRNFDRFRRRALIILNH